MESSAQPRVLICDDTPSIGVLVSMNLELDGFVVEQETSALRALERLHDPEAPPIDLMLLDLHMAPRSGWWAIGEIRADDNLADLPVVAVTAALFGVDHDSLSEAGFDALLAKPFAPDDLLAVVSRSLEHRGQLAAHP